MTTSAPARAHVESYHVPIPMPAIGGHGQDEQRMGMEYAVMYADRIQATFRNKAEAKAYADGINAGIDIARSAAQRLVQAL
jgi:hypothetical protein